MGRRYELPTIAEEEEVKSSSYESVTEEEGAPEANPTREAPEGHRMPEAAAGDRREPPVTPARAPASRKRAAGPDEEEGSSDSRGPRHRSHGRSPSRARAGQRTPSPPPRPRSPVGLPGAYPKSRPMVPEPPQPPHKGRGKGFKPQKPRCRFCWKEVTAHESGQSQHEYWSTYCLSWQFKRAGYPHNECDQLAEDLKQRRLERFERLGPDPDAHVAFPEQPGGTAAPALATRPALPASSYKDSRVPASAEERKEKKEKKKKQKEAPKEPHKDSRKEKKREKSSKAAAHDAAPEKKAKKKKNKGNKIHVIAVSPSPETMRRRKREPRSSSESDSPEENLRLVSCGGGKYRLIRG